MVAPIDSAQTGSAPPSEASSSQSLRAKLAEQAHQEGLQLLGIVALQEEGRYEAFHRWLSADKHADMAFLERYQDCRRDPRLLLAGATTALILGMPYYLGDKYTRQPPRPQVAQYARLRDYHRGLRSKAEKLLARLLEEEGSGLHVGRVVVDSAPVLERALAARTARGFIGKNTLFIHPEQGSFFMLAEVVTSLYLPPDLAATVAPDTRSAEGGCGSCRRCQVYCPTGALAEDYTLDARRCLAYYTIEHRGTIPLEFWPWLRLYLFGCDICQLVCPYNRKAPVAAQEELKIKQTPPLAAIATMSQEYYVEAFAGTPMTRAKRDGLRRNALIAMVVTSDAQLPQVMAQLALDPSPLIQDTLAQIPLFKAQQGC